MSGTCDLILAVWYNFIWYVWYMRLDFGTILFGMSGTCDLILVVWYNFIWYVWYM